MTTLPYVISAGARGRGEICGVVDLSWKCFSTERSAEEGPVCLPLKGVPGHDDPPLCHLDRSAAQWRDLRYSGPFMEMFFDRAQRRGGTCGCLPLKGVPGHDDPPLCHLDRSVAQWRDLRYSGPFMEMFFDRAPRRGGTSG